MKSIIFSLDYELYGNGSGNIYTHVIEPTERILALAELYNVKLTFFVEIVEFWRIQEEWQKGNTMGYKKNPIEDIKLQLQKAYKQGHDIQLHIHPQWCEAEYNNGYWKVNLKDWRLGGYNKQGEFSLINLLKNGKATLESWITPIDKEYKCIALRAGGYNIQPSKDIVTAMKEPGLVIDSSIYPGGKETGILSNYDYSNIDSDKEWWQTGIELEKEGKNGIIELPIVAFPIKRWRKFASIERIKSLLKNSRSARDSFKAKTNSGSRQKSSMSDKVKYFFQEEWQTWDYCLFSSSLHDLFLKEVKKQRQRKVFILVGHPKGYMGGSGFRYLLEKTKDEYKYITINEFYNNECAGNKFI